MKTEQIGTREYAQLAGYSIKAGMVSKRLRHYANTGDIIGLPGVIGIKRLGREWILECLSTWVDVKREELNK